MSNYTDIPLRFIKVDYPTISCIRYRPRFYLNLNNLYNPTVCWDSCADISVWCTDISYLLSSFPNAYIQEGYYAYLNGFGLPDKNKHKIAIIPELCVGGLIIKNLTVILRNMNINCDLLLQSNIFKKTNVVDYQSCRLRIPEDIPAVYVNRVMDKDGLQVMDTNVFYQNELYIDDYTNNSGIISEEVATSLLPEDFTAYAKSKGWSENQLAQDIISKMPYVMLDLNKSLLDNALVGWDSYKRFT